MRKKLRDRLAQALDEQLQQHFVGLRRLNPRKEEFNGSFGYMLGCFDGSCYFFTVIAHDERDTFQALISWAQADKYPTHPFRDLAASLRGYLASTSAELQLGEIVDLPLEFALDVNAQESVHAQDAIAQKLAKGEVVTPDEWIKTLQVKSCPVEQAVMEANRLAPEIAAKVRDAVVRVRAGRGQSH